LRENLLIGKLLEPVYHALKDGAPLCGWTIIPPERWHKDRRAVPYTELDKITCPRCKRLAQETIEKEAAA
jgi:hypothetical protein